MYNLTKQCKILREKLLSDELRPKYHFTPLDSDCVPGDPNGAFFADGRYHLMYLYRTDQTNCYHWGHISSSDLLHWQHHPDALLGEDGDSGCFSGGGFLDDDGTAYISFWKFPSKDFKTDNGGIDIAFSKPPYDKWERIRPLVIEGSREVWGTMDVELDGKIEHLGCADPSNIWKENGFYYMQLGNLPVLNAYGRNEDSEDKYTGGWTELFRSKDMKNWEFLHRFYTEIPEGPDTPDETEDDMCPSFLPLYDKKSNGKKTDKWLQCFISHNRGGQYFIGEFKDEKFYPELHGRFTWNDKHCFAPENLIDDKNRQICWFWLTDNRENEFQNFGWSGVYSFPRILWYEDNMLKMAPAEELDRLQTNEQNFSVGNLDGKTELTLKNGKMFRIKAEIDMKNSKTAGFIVRADDDGGQYVHIYYDENLKTLIMKSKTTGEYGGEFIENAPFELNADEKLMLDIFVDECVFEVYANERQAICRRAYPENPSKAVKAFAVSDGAEFLNVTAWEMNRTNPF